MALIIYTKPNCPYCERAIEHYAAAGIEFQEYDAQNDLRHQADMLAISGGDVTVPCIVEDGRHIASGWGDPPRGCTIIPADRAV